MSEQPADGKSLRLFCPLPTAGKTNKGLNIYPELEIIDNYRRNSKHIEEDSVDTAAIIIFLAAMAALWYVVNRWILPRLGRTG